MGRLLEHPSDGPCSTSGRPGLAFEVALAEAEASISHGLLAHQARRAAAGLVGGQPWQPLARLLPGLFPGSTGSGRARRQPAPGGGKRRPGPAGAASPAAQLQRGVAGVAAPDSLREAVLPAAPPALEQRPNLAVRIGSLLQPQGETQCDRTPAERWLNVATSLPFSLVGLHMLRQRQLPEARRHSASLVAVGLAAGLYHASAGAFRPLARKLDYWTIAWSASEMVKALHPGSTLARRAANASLLAVPFKPFLVSTLHTAVLEYEFIKEARRNKGLRRDLALHASTAAVGTAAFFLEDVVKDHGGFEYMHAIWHCLSAFGVGTIGGLVAHKERRHLQRQRLGGSAQPVHCSASSLADLTQQRPAGGKGGPALRGC